MSNVQLCVANVSPFDKLRVTGGMLKAIWFFVDIVNRPMQIRKVLNLLLQSYR